MKKCSKCKVEKGLEEFTKDKRRENGLRSQCKYCEKEYRQAYLTTHKEETRKTTKLYRESHKEEEKARKKAYREAHKEEIKEKRRQYRAEHKEEEQRKRRRALLKFKERDQKYRDTHKTKIKNYNKLYRLTPKGQMAQKNKQSRRRATSRETDITTNWLTALHITATHCLLCNIQLTDIPNLSNSKHLDHMIPLIIEGKHIMSNVRIVCRTCNLTRFPTRDKEILNLIREEAIKYGSRNIVCGL